MLINAYQLFENYEGEIFKELAMLFTKTATQVCEGQQYDIDFAGREEVSIDDYLKMIEFKTAVLVGASLQMGAIIAETSAKNKQAIYEYGRLLGIAFQLQDDYLDAFGDPETFGKQVGGDIIENKKTFLYLTALQTAEKGDARQLEDLYSIQPGDTGGKVESVKHIFEKSGAAELIKEEIRKFTNEAFNTLGKMDLEDNKKAILKKFGESLMNRTV